MEVDRVFSDWGVSGKLKSRPDLDRMIQYLEEKNKKFTTIDLVLVDDFDRIIRDVQWRWEIKLKVEWAWAKIFSLKQDLNDTPEGKMLQSITMATKQYERENNGRRVRDRQIARLKDWYWTFKQFPGYMYIKDPDRWGKILVPKQPDFDIIREALTLFSDGVLVNAKALQEFLNNRWIQSVEKCKIYLSLAMRLITPKVLDHYLWYISYEPRDIKRMVGKHPKMLTESVVEKILDRINPKKSYKDSSPWEISEQLPLRSILKCEVCGHPITWAPSKNRTWNIYYYYTCRKSGCSMYAKSFQNKEVHKSLETYLSSLSFDDQRYDLCHLAFQKIWDNRKSLAEDKLLWKKKRSQEIGLELERIQERLFKTEDEKLISVYEKKLKELSEEQDRATLSIMAFDNEIEGINPVQTLERWKNYLQNPRQAREKWNLKTKRLFMKALLWDNIYYNRKTGIQTLEKPALYKDTSILTWHNSYLVGDIGLEPMTPCL